MSSDLNSNRFWNEIAALNRSNATKQKQKRKMRSSIHPLKPGTQDQDPTKQMPFLPCTQGQRFHLWCSFLVPSRSSHGLDGSTICICCFSIFNTPHLFALFAASPGFKQSLQLFYLYYPPPICVLYHPYPCWVRTCVELHVLPFTLRGPATYLHGFRLQFA